MQEKIILAPSLEGNDYLKSLAAFNKDPKLTFGVRIFNSVELAKYLMQLNGVSCDKKFIPDVILTGKLYKLVKKIPYFEKSSFEDVYNLLKSVNDLRRCIPFDEGKAIEEKLPKDLFKKKNEAIISFYRLMMSVMNEKEVIDEIGLIRYAIDNCKSVNNIEFVGDTTLTKLLYERRLCGEFNPMKMVAFQNLLESTEERVIVFYNFWDEVNVLTALCETLQRPVSVVNGKDKYLYAYKNKSDSVTFVQYQAGAMGLNLQKANRIIYFTPTLSSELFEQSKKRIHRIGQNKPCFYYYLTVRGSVEEHIYKVLEMRKDYTEALFEES